MFGDFNTADYIAIICYNIDCRCREELRNNIITSERDYVSSLTTLIRDAFTRHGMRSHSQSIRGGDEQKCGVDGIFVFRHNNSIKVGIFEGKRPQITQDNYPWDYLSKRNMSHFSEQISKQHIWLDQFAIWEMFFNETNDGYLSPPLEFFGSTCIWHLNSYNHMNSNTLIFTPWKTKNLSDLSTTSSQNFYSIIFDIISCKQGKVYSIDELDINIRIVNDNNESVQLDIPLPSKNNQEFDEKINRFLIESDFHSYVYLDFSTKNFKPFNI